MPKERFKLAKCVVCKKTFKKNNPKSNYHYHHGSRGNYYRPSHSKTCSRPCTRIYVRRPRK